jgi:hypothetical protein
MQFRDILASIARTSLVLGAMSASAFVSANDYNGNWNCGPQASCPTTCCPAPCCDAAPDCAFGFNPPAHQRCGGNSCGGFADNLTGRVDFLYWRPCSEGTALGYTEKYAQHTSGNSQSVETFTTFDETHIRDLNFKFDAGFRLGLGYYCPSNCWDIAVNWTHFHSKANAFGASDLERFDVDDSTLFYDNWTRQLGYFPEAAKERWTLDLNSIDVEFAQKFYVNHCFILRPHFGLRFARIDQNVHVESYANQAFKGIFDYDTFTSAVKSKNNFRGVGPRVGLDLEINLGCNIALYGKGAASLVYGEFDRESEQVLSATNGDTTVFNDIYKGKGKDDRCTVTMTDLTIGLKWEHCFECCNTYHPFSLGIAWEQNASPFPG